MFVNSDFLTGSLEAWVGGATFSLAYLPNS
jgi:hypothetical protein